MYYAVNIDENGETIDMDISSLEGWTMDSDLAQELVNSGYIAEEDGTFTGRNGERCKIIEEEAN